MSVQTFLFKKEDGNQTKRAKLVDASEFVGNEEEQATPNEISYGITHKPLVNFVGEILNDGAKLKLEDTNIPTGMDFSDYRWINFAQLEGTATQTQLTYRPLNSDEDELYLQGVQKGYVCIIGYEL